MPERQQVITTTDQETKNLGKKFAEVLKGGDVVGLFGDLGAGKTTFVKGVARGLGFTKTVKSPSFTLMNVYPTKHKIIKQLVHIDCYRLTDASQLEEIGVLEYFDRKDSVVIIEWAEKVKKLLPKDMVKVQFKVKGEEEREVVF